MSLFYKCDICGKDSSQNNVDFTNMPIELSIDGVENKKFRVYLNINIEDEKDIETSKMIYDEVMKELEGMEMTEEDVESITASFVPSTNLPVVCNMCKKELAFKVMKNGTYRNDPYMPFNKNASQPISLKDILEKIDNIPVKKGKNDKV